MDAKIAIAVALLIVGLLTSGVFALTPPFNGDINATITVDGTTCKSDQDFNDDGITNKEDKEMFVSCIYYEQKCNAQFDLNSDGMYTIVGDVPCFIEQTGTTPIKPFSVAISPEKQVTSNGEAEFLLEIKDLHGVADQIYYYKIEDVSEQQSLKLTFEETTAQISGGETQSIRFKVKTNEKGSNYFKIAVTEKSSEYRDAAAGVLVYDTETKPGYGGETKPGNDGETEPGVTSTLPVEGYTSAVFFQGDGFLTSYDENLGKLISLHILRDDKDGSTIKGKLNLNNENFRIEGSTQGESINFNVYSINNDLRVGSFSGKVIKFDEFLLMRGELSLDYGTDAIEVWQLTATSKKQVVFIDVYPVEAKTSKQASLDNVIVVKEDDSPTAEAQGEVYIEPVEIKEEKFLWIIPTGKKSVVVEITSGDETTKKKVKEFGSTNVGNYEISIGSLSDEENIEFGVKKIA